jgi:hypothetical protein
MPACSQFLFKWVFLTSTAKAGHGQGNTARDYSVLQNIILFTVQLYYLFETEQATERAILGIPDIIKIIAIFIARGLPCKTRLSRLT